MNKLVSITRTIPRTIITHRILPNTRSNAILNSPPSNPNDNNKNFWIGVMSICLGITLIQLVIDIRKI